MMSPKFKLGPFFAGRKRACFFNQNDYRAEFILMVIFPTDFLCCVL